MNFDYGNVLTRALQITWKHKAIWGVLILPMLAALLPFVLFFVFFAIVTLNLQGDISETMSVTLLVSFLLALTLAVIANIGLGSLSVSAATLGIIRADREEGSTKFMDLVKDGIPYFWRVLGVLLVINLTIGLVFTIFFVLSFALILVTMGMASICLQPIMLLFTPFSFLLVAVIEAAQIAVIADDLDVMGAIKHAIQLVRTHVWKYVVITLIVYFGSSIVSSFVVTPIMLPVFLVPAFLELGQDVSTQTIMLISGLFACIFVPLMLLVSSVIGVFMKASLDLTYLRLTAEQRKTENQVIFSE